MNIIAKSAPVHAPLEGKSNINNKIEIQLFNEFESGKTYKPILDEILSVDGVDIYGVHVPIIESENINIEFVNSFKNKHRLGESIKLAGELSRHYDHNIKVIIHTSFPYIEYDTNPPLFDSIVYFFEEYFHRYPKLEFCLENVTPIEFNKQTKEFKMRNGIFFDNVKLAKRLNSCFGTTRFGTVLDTCHAMMALRVFDRVFFDYPRFKDFYTLEDYFKENKDVVKLIHLADLKNLGYNKDEHGVKFENKEDMKIFLDLYKKYDYDCDITIEIKEDDYIINDNFRDNFEKLKSICDELKIPY